MSENEVFTVRFPASLVDWAQKRASSTGETIEQVLEEWIAYRDRVGGLGDLMVAIHGGEGLDLTPLMQQLEKDREQGDDSDEI